MTEDQFFSEKPQANILQQIVQRYMPFWPVFVVLIGVALGISHVYLRAQTKIYTAAAKVMIKDPQKSSSEMQVLEGITKMADKKSIENEIIVLRSSNLMQKVVKELNLYASVFNEGNVQTEELYRDNAPVVFEALNKDSIREGGKHKFEINWQAYSLNIAGQTASLNEGIVYIGGTAYRILPNKSYNTTVQGKNFFAVFNSVEAKAGSFVGGLRASPSSFGSTVLDISIQTPVPERGLDVLGKSIHYLQFGRYYRQKPAVSKNHEFY